jgi:hypothetical protein
MEYVRKKVLACGRVHKLPEQMTRATKFPMVVPNTGMKLTSRRNYSPSGCTVASEILEICEPLN